MKAHQRIIREREALTDDGGMFGYPVADIKQARCSRISFESAKEIILQYEWLGTMGQGLYCYGIFFSGVLAGAVCFVLPAGLESGAFCGKEFADKAICLERGACTHWAHEHSASKLISFAINDMYRTTKYRIFYAYSDEDAGEIGTVYQACNWLYFGKMASGGSQNKLLTPAGKQKDSRHIIRYARIYDKKIDNATDAREILLANGWKNRKTKPKSKYAILKGTKKEIKVMMDNLRYKIKPYPKRDNPSLYNPTLL